MASTILHTIDLGFAHDATNSWTFPDFSLALEDKLLVLGESGSGKTTFLHLLCGLLSPKQGDIVFNGQSYAGLSKQAMDQLRAQHMGLIFQRPHFIKSLSVAENISLAGKLGGQRINTADIDHLLESLHIAHTRNKKTHQLSEGQKQRASIARALACKPAILFADEPTSALDDANAAAVTDLLLQAAEQSQCALVIVTHDARIKPHFSLQYNIARQLISR